MPPTLAPNPPWGPAMAAFLHQNYDRWLILAQQMQLPMTQTQQQSLGELHSVILNIQAELDPEPIYCEHLRWLAEQQGACPDHRC